MTRIHPKVVTVGKKEDGLGVDGQLGHMLPWAS